MRRTDLSQNICPVARSLNVVGDGWSLLVVRDALRGLRRFGEFQKSLGLAKNILAARLRALVEAGILEITPASDGSAYHDYVLTPKGRDLVPVLEAMATWGNTHCKASRSRAQADPEVGADDGARRGRGKRPANA
jgi:DNA-binding HxlR family transcriptional regulator